MTAQIPSQIILPQVPDDFNNGVGKEFAQELLLLIGQATIELNPTTNPDSFDVAKIMQSLAEMQSLIDKNHREVRRVVLRALTDADLLVSFDDIGTVDYTVTAMLLVDSAPPAAPGQYNIWEVIGTRTTQSVTLHCKGTINAFQLGVTIIENKTQT